MVLTEPASVLADRLVRLAPFSSKVFLASTGCEANEGALKIALLHGQAVSPSKTRVVAFDHSFHGRTLGALSITSKPVYRKSFDPYLTGTGSSVRPDHERFADFNNLESAAKLVNDDTCAIFVEPVQGEGGVNVATPEFLRGLRELCDRHNALLIFDEVQIGLSRSGGIFASSVYDVTPDVMTLAKPLGGGLPVAAILCNDRAAKSVSPGIHGTTFGGSPIGAAAANAVLDVITTPEFLRGVSLRSEYIMNRLKDLKHPKITQVRGLGLLIGVQLNVPAAPIIEKARDMGALFISAGDDILRLAPALNITYEEIDTALSILAKALD